MRVSPSRKKAAGDGRLIVCANRLPVRRVGRGPTAHWEISPGGLVAAMAPILKERKGSWVGWSGTPGAAPDPFEHEGISIRPVPISQKEVSTFYLGMSNKTFWPLYHDAVRPPAYHRRWWWPYVDVNRRFAEAVADVARPGDTVWAHDYQLQLAPAMIRELAPKVRIGFFLHIPFPPEELFAQLPWRRQILEGLLGADLLGFQTKLGAHNFARAATRYTEAKGSDSRGLHYRGRKVEVGAYPISIDTEKVERLAESAEVVERVQQLKQRVGDWRKIFLGVDRLDYTKGIDIRLRAFEEFLKQGDFSTEDCVLVQIAVPSREAVSEYAQLRESVEQIVGRINGEHGQAGMAAVHYLHRGLPFEELVSYYASADVMVVTPLRDGMNLVAKEYVASRIHNDGRLLLSEFTGAAQELKQAVLVNPHDIDGLANAMHACVQMSEEDATKRMRSMRRVVQQHDVFRWADTFVGELAS